MFARGVAELAEVIVSVKRLQFFLECEEIHPEGISNVENPPEVDDTAISMRNVSAKWNVKKDVNVKAKKFLGTTEESKYSNERPSLALDQLNLRIEKGSLVGVIGCVGSGNTIFHCYLKIPYNVACNCRKEFIPSSFTK